MSGGQPVFGSYGIFHSSVALSYTASLYDSKLEFSELVL